jgi:hypothetical protein
VSVPTPRLYTGDQFYADSSRLRFDSEAEAYACLKIVRAEAGTFGDALDLER